MTEILDERPHPVVLWCRSSPSFKGVNEWILECLRWGKEGGWICLKGGGEFFPEVAGALLAYEGLQVVLDLTYKNVDSNYLRSWSFMGIGWFLLNEESFKLASTHHLPSGIHIGFRSCGDAFNELFFAVSHESTSSRKMIRFIEQKEKVKDVFSNVFIKDADGIILQGELEEVLKILWRLKGGGTT